MATAVRSAETTGNRTPRPGAAVLAPSGVVGRILLAAGIVYLVASLFDLGILWLAQRQDTIQWEFVALSRTAESYPRLILAIAFLSGGLWVQGTVSRLPYRILGALILILGIGALTILGLVGLNYATLSSAVGPDAESIFRSATLKTVGLSVIYVLVLFPVGILSFKRVQ